MVATTLLNCNVSTLAIVAITEYNIYIKDKDIAMDKTQVNVKNVPVDLLAKARELAKQNDRPLSIVIRDLLREWVAKQEKQPTK